MTGQLFSLGTPVSSTNKTDCYNIIEILLKVALKTMNLEIYKCLIRYSILQNKIKGDF
jgi:hypothetical protein